MIDRARQFILRCAAFLRPVPLDHELDAEMAFHLEAAFEENVRAGMNETEARRNALIQFGGRQQDKEIHRESRGLPFLDQLGQDLRYTFRSLRKDRAFAAIAILILAL